MKKYLVNDIEVIEEEFFYKLKECVNNCCEEDYDDWLDEIYDKVCIGASTFYPSQILQNCDPIAYQLGLDDHINAEYENIIYELEYNDYIIVDGTKFVITIENDEDDNEH